MVRSALVMALGLVSDASAEIRAFTNDNGTVIQAELVSHQGGKVTLKRLDGKEFSVDPSIFSADDEAHISAWMAKTPAVKNYNLKLSAEKKKVESNTRNYGYKRVKNDLWSYMITVLNSSQIPVSNLSIKYRVFYTNSADGSYSASSDERMAFRMVEGSSKLKEELAYNRSMQFSTTPVQIDVVDYDYGSRYKDEVKGCLVRITDEDGKIVIDWRSPEVAIREKTWENTTPGGGDHEGKSVIIR